MPAARGGPVAGDSTRVVYIRMAPEDDLVGADAPRDFLRGASGILPRQAIRALLRRRSRIVRAAPEIEESQLQPASMDLRVGAKAYRVRASFLPGKAKTVAEQLAALKYDEIDIERGAVLEKGCVYVVELIESLDLPDSIAAVANPKSSTGRLDIFTRLIVDRSESFDKVPGGYSGPLYAEISPSSFSIRLRKGSRLNQIRFRRRSPSQSESVDMTLPDRMLREEHQRAALVEGEPALRNGLLLGLDLSGAGPGGLVGYKAQRFTDVIDVDEVGRYAVADFWERIEFRPEKRIILDPHQFYILASKERIRIPPYLAAEMVPIDPMMGEFRVHYAGFFDPGFGATADGRPGARAVLEVRSHEVPFVLEDGQLVGRLVFERLAEKPDILYGEIATSNYQGQGLKLSKHFREG